GRQSRRWCASDQFLRERIGGKIFLRAPAPGSDAAPSPSFPATPAKTAGRSRPAQPSEYRRQCSAHAPVCWLSCSFAGGNLNPFGRVDRVLLQVQRPKRSLLLLPHRLETVLLIKL